MFRQIFEHLLLLSRMHRPPARYTHNVWSIGTTVARVCVSVCHCVEHTCGLRKNGRTNCEPVWSVNLCGPTEPNRPSGVRAGPDHLTGTGNFAADDVSISYAACHATRSTAKLLWTLVF